MGLMCVNCINRLAHCAAYQFSADSSGKVEVVCRPASDALGQDIYLGDKVMDKELSIWPGDFNVSVLVSSVEGNCTAEATATVPVRVLDKPCKLGPQCIGGQDGKPSDGKGKNTTGELCMWRVGFFLAAFPLVLLSNLTAHVLAVGSSRRAQQSTDRFKLAGSHPLKLFKPMRLKLGRRTDAFLC